MSSHGNDNNRLEVRMELKSARTILDGEFRTIEICWGDLVRRVSHCPGLPAHKLLHAAVR